MIIIFLLVLILIIIFLYLKTEHEQFVSMPVDTIDSVSKHECYLLVDSVLNNINNKFKKNFIRGNLDRVEKTNDELNNSINYKINIFIYNPDKNSNRKILFDITYDNKNIVLNSMKNGVSSEVLSLERDAVDSRGSIVYKPKVNIDKVMKYNTLKNNFSFIDFKETSDKHYSDISRTSWILTPDAEMYDNENNVIKSEYIKIDWDCFGIPTNEEKVIRHTPNFIKSNYTEKNDMYDWLFNTASDSASRPIGITGATGSS
jgi:hypothetical protein